MAAGVAGRLGCGGGFASLAQHGELRELSAQRGTACMARGELRSPRIADRRQASTNPQLVLSGSVDLSPLAEGGTEAACKLQASGKGSLGKIINSLLKDRLSKEAAGFAENHQRILLE